MKPGIYTSEFYHSLIAQVLTLLALLGVESSNDTKTLEEALGKCVTGIFALIVNGVIVYQYVRGRLVLKTTHLNNDIADTRYTLAPDKPAKDPFLPTGAPFLLAGALGLLAIGDARAQTIFYKRQCPPAPQYGQPQPYAQPGPWLPWPGAPPGPAAPSPAPSPGACPCPGKCPCPTCPCDLKAVLAQIADLRAYLAVIEKRQAIPGPQGPRGQAGPQGPQGAAGTAPDLTTIQDELAALKARVSALQTTVSNLPAALRVRIEQAP
jgi:hypothetical protein